MSGPAWVPHFHPQTPQKATRRKCRPNLVHVVRVHNVFLLHDGIRKAEGNLMDDEFFIGRDVAAAFSPFPSPSALCFAYYHLIRATQGLCDQPRSSSTDGRIARPADDRCHGLASTVRLHMTCSFGGPVRHVTTALALSYCMSERRELPRRMVTLIMIIIATRVRNEEVTRGVRAPQLRTS